LGNISDEIKYLQGESSSISVKLNNRRKLEERLATFVDGVVLSKGLVNGICTMEVRVPSFLFFFLFSFSFSFSFLFFSFL